MGNITLKLYFVTRENVSRSNMVFIKEDNHAMKS